MILINSILENKLYQLTANFRIPVIPRIFCNLAVTVLFVIVIETEKLEVCSHKQNYMVEKLRERFLYNPKYLLCIQFFV